jgi:hypothetical protein
VVALVCGANRTRGGVPLSATRAVRRIRGSVDPQGFPVRGRLQHEVSRYYVTPG